MAKIRSIKKENGVTKYSFHCPGCNRTHSINDKVWNFNGDFEKPTIRASVLFRSGHHIEGHRDKDCWCDWNKKHPDKRAPFECVRCHSFITDGKIRFLNNCTHELAGQTVELPEFESPPSKGVRGDDPQ